jgi:hypothetical protein
MHAEHNPRETTAKARRKFWESFATKAAAEGYYGRAMIKRAATLRAAFYAEMTAESIRVRKLRRAVRTHSVLENTDWAA